MIQKNEQIIQLDVDKQKLQNFLSSEKKGFVVIANKGFVITENKGFVAEEIIPGLKKSLQQYFPQDEVLLVPTTDHISDLKKFVFNNLKAYIKIRIDGNKETLDFYRGSKIRNQYLEIIEEDKHPSEFKMGKLSSFQVDVKRKR